MSTRAVEVLLETMDDKDLFARRRIQAAEALLGFEAPAEAVSRAREYLAQVFEDKENADMADRMEAAQITRKYEAKKIAPQTVHLTRREETDRKEAWREYEIGRRKMDLIKATHQHPPPGWKDDLLSPDYLPPPGSDWPPGTVERSGRLKVVYDREKERG